MSCSQKPVAISSTLAGHSGHTLTDGSRFGDHRRATLSPMNHPRPAPSGPREIVLSPREVLPPPEDLFAYFGDDDPLVVAFLAAHPAVRRVLDEASDPLQHYFGEGVYAELEVVTEPAHPAPATTQQLFVRVAVPVSADEAVARQECFDEGWWLDVLAARCIPLTFTAGPA